MQMGQQWQWNPCLRHMQAQLNAQMEQLKRMEQSIVLLQAELQACKEKKTIHIDKIEYKFDQLKVEKLDGTMNIGLTPSVLEDIAVNGNVDAGHPGMDSVIKQAMSEESEPILTIPTDIRAEIHQKLQSFVEGQLPKYMEQLQQHSGETLDAEHQILIIKDISKQLEARMDYYLKQMSQGVTGDQMSSIKDSVIFRTENDIRAAIRLYFEKITKRAGVPYEFSCHE